MVRKLGPTTPRGYFIHKRGGHITDHSLFTDDNDHNPQVAQKCPKCDGKGVCCLQCQGLGLIDEPGEWFTNGEPERTVRPNAYGFLQCPGCGTRFSRSDKNVWTGRRHTCGQKIRLELGDVAAEQDAVPDRDGQ